MKFSLSWIPRFIGPRDWPLELRLFHMALLTSGLSVLIISLVYLFLANYPLSLSCFIFGILAFPIRGISYRKRFYLFSLVLFIILALALISAGYLLSGGGASPIIFALLVPILMMCAVVPRRFIVYLFLVAALVVSLLMLWGSTGNPSAQSQGANAVHPVETYAIFMGLLINLAAGIYLLKEQNELQSKQIDSQFKAIQSQNQQIESHLTELEESNEQKDRLFSIIGHDLRNPLASIEGYLQVMDDQGAEEIDEEQKEIKDQLLRLTQNSRNLLDNLLEWAKKDTKPQLDRVNLQKCTNKALETLHPIARRKGIKLQVLLDEPNTEVIADTNMLEMVLRNLVSNAIKFTAENGWIKVRSYTHKDCLSLEVEDNGMGMSKEDSEKIFTPQRNLNAGTNQEKGVGLGLILCREFVHKMKGSISCKSIPEKGSNFQVKLPIPQ